MNQTQDKIHVMLVDDSAVIRGLISRSLEKDDQIKVTASVSNGELAVKMVKNANPDVIILDIEMPVMDGITAIPLLLKEKPGAKILMCSTLSKKGATISLQAMSLGASDTIVKPSGSSEMNSAENFQQDLIARVKSLGIASIKSQGKTFNASSNTASQGQGGAETGQLKTITAQKAKTEFSLRQDPHVYSARPSILAIGSSTGGPQALFNVLKHVNQVNIPIVITQHMPKTFTTILAEHITSNCNLPCHEAADNITLEPGHAYVAPGGFHMILKKNPETQKVYTKIDDGPPESFCKPSVEPMMRSVIELYGQKALALILTGMGSDGVKACTQLAENHGRVIAQDEESSTVWGMPGAVAKAGICQKVLPLEEIGPHIKRLIMG